MWSSSGTSGAAIVLNATAARVEDATRTAIEATSVAVGDAATEVEAGAEVGDEAEVEVAERGVQAGAAGIAAAAAADNSKGPAAAVAVAVAVAMGVMAAPTVEVAAETEARPGRPGIVAGSEAGVEGATAAAKAEAPAFQLLGRMEGAG